MLLLSTVAFFDEQNRVYGMGAGIHACGAFPSGSSDGKPEGGRSLSKTYKRSLNFGCGMKINPGGEWVNVDIQKHEGIDVSFDFEEFPYPLEDNSFDYIVADNVLEHLNRCDRVVDEFYRICRDNAEILVRVPYWNAKCAYNDPTHVRFFNERAILLLFGVQPSYLHSMPHRFELISLKLVPSNMCRYIPSPLRFILSTYICNVIRAVEARFRAKK